MSREIREGLLEEGATVSSQGKSIKSRHGRKHTIEGTGESGHDQTRKGFLLVRSQSLLFELRALGSYGELR